MSGTTKCGESCDPWWSGGPRCALPKGHDGRHEPAPPISADVADALAVLDGYRNLWCDDIHERTRFAQALDTIRAALSSGSAPAREDGGA
jgi:hypothetical protein